MTLPNALTVLRIILTPVVVVLFLLQGEYCLFAASIVFVVAAFTDWYDGFYARRYNVVSRWGQYMDPLADKFLVSGVLIAFWLKGFVFSWIIWSIILRDVIVTGLRSYAIWRGKPVVTSQLAKFKTFLQMGAIFYMLLYLNFIRYSQLSDTAYTAKYTDIPSLLFLLATILAIVSGIQYIYENKHLFIK